MSQDDSDEDLTHEGLADVASTAPFPKHRIVTSRTLNTAMASLTPGLISTFVTNQSHLLDRFCIEATKQKESEWDFESLLLNSFHMFYSCLAHELHDAQPEVHHRLMQIYSERLAMNFYRSEDEALTLMIDLLPESVYQDASRSESWKMLRMTFEMKLNQLH